MFNSIFKTIYFIEFLITIVIRKIYTRKPNKDDLKTQSKSSIEMILLVFNGIGMIIPLIYVFSSWFDFANYNLPIWLAWTGVVLFAFAIVLLWKSHYDLGKNWSAIVAIKLQSELITNGVYKFIRHPMYTAHLMWALAQILILHNWIAGYSFLIVQIPFYFVRIKNEEKIMINEFGEEYKNYIKETNYLIPKVL